MGLIRGEEIPFLGDDRVEVGQPFDGIPQRRLMRVCWEVRPDPAAQVWPMNRQHNSQY